MHKRFIPVTIAALLVFTACTATPTATPGTNSSASGASFDGGMGFGSGNRDGSSKPDTGWVATASVDSSTATRGGGAIGSGN